VAPLDLAPFYADWDASPLHAKAWLPAALLVLVVGGFFALRRQLDPIVKWGLVMFAAFLFPVIGFLRFGNLATSWVSDHFLYDASIGFYTAVVVCVTLLLRADVRRAKVAAAAAVGAIIACSALTLRQIPVWHDSLTFWQRVIDMQPGYVGGYLGR